MKKYIGVKEINAKPMTRQEYNDFRGWVLPEDENGDDVGFLLEYIDGGQANTDEYAGYVSWSPADVFNRAYRPVTGMPFGLAIEAAKKGYKIARAGWNGKGMFVYLTRGRLLHPNSLVGECAEHILPVREGARIRVCDHLDMKAADGSIVVGWLASQTDILSDDWMIV